MPTDAEIVGKRIRALREARAWTQQALAKRINSSKSQIVRWEHGRDMPRIDKREAIAMQLGQCVEVLFHVGPERDAAMEDRALAAMLDIMRNAKAPPAVQLSAAKGLRAKSGSAKSGADAAMQEFRRLMEEADENLTRILEELEAEDAKESASPT
jgi:XRE family transcriptional regulator, fatty acid utilization regulator